MPHVEFDYDAQLRGAFDSPDAMRARVLSGVREPDCAYTARGDPRMPLQVAQSVHALVCRLWGAVLALPAHAMRPLVNVLENTVVAFETRLATRMHEMLRPRLGESSCEKLMNDPRRRPILVTDPHYARARAALASSSSNGNNGGGVEPATEESFCVAEERLEKELYDGVIKISARTLLDHDKMTQLAHISDTASWFASQLYALVDAFDSVRSFVGSYSQVFSLLCMCVCVCFGRRARCQYCPSQPSPVPMNSTAVWPATQ